MVKLQLLCFIFLFFIYFLHHLNSPNAWADVDGWWLKRGGLMQGSAFWGSRYYKISLRGLKSSKTLNSSP
jgi:hypothetical protein